MAKTLCFEPMDAGALQLAFRIPCEISGEQDGQNLDLFMLLPPFANRAKSWICENCKKWVRKDAAFCAGCFWAYPEGYAHIAGKRQRMITLIFTGSEIEDYCRLTAMAGTEGTLQAINGIVRGHLNIEGGFSKTLLLASP